MAGVRNLRQVEAAERARLLHVGAYDISLDLTDGAGYPGERTFHSVTGTADATLTVAGVSVRVRWTQATPLATATIGDAVLSLPAP